MNLIRREMGSDQAWYHYNAHGDVAELTDGRGLSIREYDYDAFGVEQNADPNDRNPFRYCGEYWEGRTETYYLRARSYAPATGRFLQRDPHWNTANMIYGDNPQTLSQRQDVLGLTHYTYTPQITAIMQSGNLYVYCGNNPLMYIDPNGEIFMLVTAAIGAAVGAVVGGVVAAATGKNVWAGIGIGAAAGGVIGLTGGAAAAYLATGTATASAVTVLSAGASWSATMAASGATTSAAIGRTFEKWFYKFNNVAQRAQQVIVSGVGRIDAFINGRIYELKNYDWSKYSNSQINNIINSFTSQAQRYLKIDNINGQAITGVVYYFSSKPPQQVVNALKEIGAKVEWVPR